MQARSSGVSCQVCPVTEGAHPIRGLPPSGTPSLLYAAGVGLSKHFQH